MGVKVIGVKRDFLQNEGRYPYDVLLDVHVPGVTPGAGAIRVQLGGGAIIIGDVDTAITEGVPGVYGPVNLDPAGFLKVNVEAADGLPLGGVAPNDYLRVFNMAPATGQYLAAPGDWGDGDAKPVLTDIKGRLIVVADPTEPVAVTLDPSPTEVFTAREQHPNGVIRMAITYSADPGGVGAVKVGSMQYGSAGKSGEVTISTDDRVRVVIYSNNADAIGGTVLERFILPANVPFKCVFTVPEDIAANRWIVVGVEYLDYGGGVQIAEGMIRGWYD